MVDALFSNVDRSVVGSRDLLLVIYDTENGILQHVWNCDMTKMLTSLANTVFDSCNVRKIVVLASLQKG